MLLYGALRPGRSPAIGNSRLVHHQPSPESRDGAGAGARREQLRRSRSGPGEQRTKGNRWQTGWRGGEGEGRRRRRRRLIWSQFELRFAWI
jgi:hypothetical protein